MQDFFKCGTINKHKPNLKLVTEMKTETMTVCAVPMPQQQPNKTDLAFSMMFPLIFPRI